MTLILEQASSEARAEKIPNPDLPAENGLCPWQVLRALSREGEIALSLEQIRSQFPQLKKEPLTAEVLMTFARSREARMQKVCWDPSNSQWPMGIPILVKRNEQWELWKTDLSGQLVQYGDNGRWNPAMSFPPLDASNSELWLWLEKESVSGGKDSLRSLFKATLLKNRGLLMTVVAASVLINLFAVAGSMYVMNVYDRVIPNSAWDTLWVLSAGVGLVYLGEFVLKSCRSRLLDYLGRGLDFSMQNLILSRVLSMRDVLGQSTGELSFRIRNFAQVRDALSTGFMVLFIDTPFLFIFLGLIAVLAGPVALVPLASVLIIFSLVFIGQRMIRKQLEKLRHSEGNYQSLMIEAVQSLGTIKGCSAQSHFVRNLNRRFLANSQIDLRTKALNQGLVNFTSLIQQFTTVAVVVFSVSRISEGSMSMGALIACMILSGRAMAPTSQLVGLLMKTGQTAEAFREVERLVASPQENKEDDALENLSPVPSIELKNLSFRYSPELPIVLDRISLKIRQGERVAVLGKAGSGKSTLLQLIHRDLYPEDGSVTLDEMDISQFDPYVIRSRLGYLSQDNNLFKDTVLANIALGNSTASEEDLMEAASLAGVLRFLGKHPKGLYLHLGERGEGLSGGQKQSICLARTLAAKPGVLLLDEPTSNVDPNTEKFLINSIRKYLGGDNREKTLVLSTHRPSILSLVDRVIVIDEGRVVADGPKTEVLQSLSGART